MSQSVGSSDAATMTGAAASSSSLHADDPQQQQPSSSSAQLPKKSPPKRIREIRKFENVSAVSLLDNELFALTSPSSYQLDVYDVKDYSPRGSVIIPLQSPQQCNFVDMAACCFNHCLYLPDTQNRRIVKLQLPGMLSVWKVDSIGRDPTVSVTSSHYLLLCDMSNKLKLFSTDGDLQMTIELQPDLVNVSSAVELSTGQYVVIHGRNTTFQGFTFGTPAAVQGFALALGTPAADKWRDQFHRVCVVNSEGKVLHAHGGFQGSHPTLLNNPRDVAVDKDGFVYVVEEKGSRLIVLSSKLDDFHCINIVPPTSATCLKLKTDKERKRVYISYVVNAGRSQSYSVEVFELLNQ